VGISGCGAGAVPSKQAKQTSKGLVLDAVRCGGGAKQTKIRSKQGLGAGAMCKQGFGAGCGLISKQGLGAWFLCWAVVLNG